MFGKDLVLYSLLGRIEWPDLAGERKEKLFLCFTTLAIRFDGQPPIGVQDLLSSGSKITQLHHSIWPYKRTWWGTFSKAPGYAF